MKTNCKLSKRRRLTFTPPDWYPKKRPGRLPGGYCNPRLHHTYCQNLETLFQKKKDEELSTTLAKKRKAFKITEPTEPKSKGTEPTRESTEPTNTPPPTALGLSIRELWNIVGGMKLFPPTHYKWNIVEGMKLDLSRLLFSPSRDYLVKNNGDKVKIDQLSGKYVVLYFAQLSELRHYLKWLLRADLEEAYSTLFPRGEFEVVFVALGDDDDDKNHFHTLFSTMPWLAIPFDDHESRALFIEKFSIPESFDEDAPLFAPDGTVLVRDSGILFRCYGPEGFPFTEEALRQIRAADTALFRDLYFKKISLTALFGDHLVSREEKLVPTSELEGKVVGLHFFRTSKLGLEMTSKLLETWFLLKKDGQHKEFEILLINDSNDPLSFAMDTFKKEFGCIPWYSLPFDGRKLSRIFRNAPAEAWLQAGYFLVLETDSPKSLSYFAFDILELFGRDAYPFTLESAVSVAKNKQKNELVLEKLLAPTTDLLIGGHTTSCLKYKDFTTVAELRVSRKRVILLFATYSCYKSLPFLDYLATMYHKMYGTDGHFEVIYMSLDCGKSRSSFSRCITEMPWLVHASAPDFAAAVARKVFALPPCLPAIAAFGPDGYLESKESDLACKEQWELEYPFTDMGEEVRRELIKTNKWDLEYYFPTISRQS